MDGSLYERWHCVGLHVVPGLLACAIAAFHEPLFH